MARPAVTEPPGRVDVDVDVLLRVLHLQVQHLGDDVVRQRVADGFADEDDPVLHQPAEQVELDQGAPFLFDDAHAADVGGAALEVGRQIVDRVHGWAA